MNDIQIADLAMDIAERHSLGKDAEEAIIIALRWFRRAQIHDPGNDEITANELQHQLHGAECQKHLDAIQIRKWLDKELIDVPAGLHHIKSRTYRKKNELIDALCKTIVDYTI